MLKTGQIFAACKNVQLIIYCTFYLQFCIISAPFPHLSSPKELQAAEESDRLKPKEMAPLFCAINHGRFLDRPICDRNVNDIIKRGVIKVKGCDRPSDLEVSGHSLRVGAAQDLLIKGYDLAAIMRAGGWSDPSTVSRYLRFSQHNIWK